MTNRGGLQGAAEPAAGPAVAIASLESGSVLHLLGRRQNLELRGEREDIVPKIPVDLDALGVDLVDLVAVALAANAVRPHNAAAHVAVSGEEGFFRVEVLVLGIAAFEQLTQRQLAGNAEIDGHGGAIGIGDVDNLHRQVLIQVAAARVEIHAGLIQTLAEDIEDIAHGALPAAFYAGLP